MNSERSRRAARILNFNEQADWYYRHMKHLSMMLVAGVDVWDDFYIACTLFELADNYHKREVHRCRATLPYRF